MQHEAVIRVAAVKTHGDVHFFAKANFGIGGGNRRRTFGQHYQIQSHRRTFARTRADGDVNGSTAADGIICGFGGGYGIRAGDIGIKIDRFAAAAVDLTDGIIEVKIGIAAAAAFVQYCGRGAVAAADCDRLSIGKGAGTTVSIFGLQKVESSCFADSGYRHRLGIGDVVLIGYAAAAVRDFDVGDV